MTLETLDRARRLLPQDLGVATEEKHEFLKWLVCGFSPHEAGVRTGISSRQIELWCADPRFVEALTTIETHQEELLQWFEDRDERKRKAKLAEIDDRILDEALDKGVQGLDKQSYDYLTQVRKTITVPVEAKKSLNLHLYHETPKTLEEMLMLIEEDHEIAEESGKKEETTIIEVESEQA